MRQESEQIQVLMGHFFSGLDAFLKEEHLGLTTFGY
jgi:hypothetical protein